jgi:type IV secretory pathway VirJ component
VAGVDIIHYLKTIGSVSGQCFYPAAHFESLSQFLQQKYNFAAYTLPVLVGYSSGATLVYAILAQSPPNTFQGGISLGFCPDLPLSKPLCKGSGDLSWVMDKKKTDTYIFNPVTHLPSPWVALQGTIDQVCFPDATKAYVEKVGNGKIIMLPKVGHGYSVPKNWMPQFKQVFRDITKTNEISQAANHPASGELSDLPLVELPVSGEGNQLAIIVTGDGGWAGIDKSLGEALNRNGIPVVGLNSLQYYWTRKSPEQSARDMSRIIRHYAKAWNRGDIILIGYSRGADVVPFMVNRLEEDARALLKEIVVLGQEPAVDFQFHVTDWLTSGEHDTSLPVMPEMEKLENCNVLCIYGSDEKGTSLCPKLDKTAFRVVEMSGGHHFGGDYDKLTKIIIDHVK